MGNLILMYVSFKQNLTGHKFVPNCYYSPANQQDLDTISLNGQCEF